MMTKTISTIKITIFLPTGELEIARIIRDSCLKKPNCFALASDAVRVLLVTGSVTCSAPLPIGLYTVVQGVVAFAACKSYTHGASHNGATFAELCAAATCRAESAPDRPCRSQTPARPGFAVRESIGSGYESCPAVAARLPPLFHDRGQAAP